MYSMNVSTGAGHTNDYGNGGNINVTTEQAGEIRIRIASGYTANNLIFKPKLEKGIVVTPYSKYGQGCVKVTKCNNNSFNKNDIVNKAYINSLGEIVSNDGQNYTNYISVVSNAMYTIHAENPLGTAPAVCFYDTNKKFISGFTYNNVKSMSFKTPSNCNFVRASVSSINLETLQIEGGPATTYVQHEEQSYIMPTQKEMLQGDYFDWDNEEEIHTWTKLVLNGTEDWFMYSNAVKLGLFAMSMDDIELNKDTSLISDISCTHFKAEKAINTWNGKEGISVDSKQIRIFCSTKDTVEKWKSYLAKQYNEGTPVVIYYKLATPEKLAFTDEQKSIAKELNNARTYKNVTNITTDSKAIIDLDYVKDLETLLNNVQALALSNASEGV